MSAGQDPAAPGTAPQPVAIMLSAADIKQLAAAMFAQAKTDAEKDFAPSTILAGIKAIPHGIKAVIKATDWPLVIVGGIAIAALALHFTDQLVKLL